MMMCFPQEIWLCIHEYSDDILARRRLEKALNWPVMGIQNIPLGKYPDYWRYREDHGFVNNVDRLFIQITNPIRYYVISLIPYDEVSYLPWQKNAASGKWDLQRPGDLSMYRRSRRTPNREMAYRNYFPKYSEDILMEYWSCWGDDDDDDDDTVLLYYEQFRDPHHQDIIPVAEYTGSLY